MIMHFVHFVQIVQIAHIVQIVQNSRSFRLLLGPTRKTIPVLGGIDRCRPYSGSLPLCPVKTRTEDRRPCTRG